VYIYTKWKFINQLKNQEEAIPFNIYADRFQIEYRDKNDIKAFTIFKDDTELFSFLREIYSPIESETMTKQPPPPTEIYGVFNVKQLTRNTALESLVAVDDVMLETHTISEIHRHNNSETVLSILEGEGIVIVDEEEFKVSKGDRICIPKGAYHGVKTDTLSLRFISVQVPPILDESHGSLDLEVKPDKK